MKIGILTFHSQLNYGGVLQCWALVQALRGLGHDAVVIDRWLDPNNSKLLGPFGRVNFRTWIGLVKGSLFCPSIMNYLLRHWRSIRFVRALGRTNYHFYDWKDAPNDLGVDCIVVGSDLVWHGGDWGDPRPYLLEGAPKIKAVAYAASFGMGTLPVGIDYASGFGRFSAISVRERDGVALVQSLGVSAAHVVDPTLLVSDDVWKKACNKSKSRNHIVCYFLSQDIGEALPSLCEWAEKCNGSVEILADGFPDIKPPSGRVRICGGYGPKEFVFAFARADKCITDSFHAVMFSSIYNCDLRFLKPKSEMRAVMFSRVVEFAENCILGNVFVNTVQEALYSFGTKEKVSYKYETIKEMRTQSSRWLEEALK